MREKREQQNRKKKHFRLLCLAAAALMLTTGTTVVQAALESEKSTAVRSVHMTDSQIESATLVIGSHLIHISALTDALYQTALESANEFNQSQLYYKSELAGGTWFEISEATSIGDITSAGTPVSKSVIEGLEFTHQTKADGITIDLRNGSAVSVFDINNPYDLRTMEELEPLRVQYQILQEKTNKNESDEIYLGMVGALFDRDIQNDTTRDCDTSLQALESYKSGLTSREKPAQWTEKVEETMTSVDAERRVESLTMLEGFLDTLENDASGMAVPAEDEESEEGEEESPPADFIINSEIVAAVGDCIQNVQESISSYAAKMLTNSGGTVASEAEYRYRQELITRARSGDVPGCDSVLQKLCNLQNILDGVVAAQDSELETLSTDLVSAAFTKYTADLRAGVSRDYQEQASQGATQAVLKKYLSEQKTAVNADRMDYQTMLEAMFTRMENQTAQNYVLRLIDGVAQLEASVVQDAAAPYLQETVADHLIWLRKAYAKLVKNASDTTAMSKLEQEKADLEKQRQDALDANDMARANELTAQMEAKQRDIDKLASDLNAILNSPNSSEADKARAAAGMGEKNIAALLNAMGDDLTSAIRNANSETSMSDLENQMAALAAAAALDPDAAVAALGRVQEALENATGLDAATAAALSEKLIEAMTTAGEGELTESALLNLLNGILQELFGGGFEGVSARQQAAAMIAMEWYGNEKDSETAHDLAATLVGQAVRVKNPYLYDRYAGKAESYLSLQTLANVLGYRYIFEDAHDMVTLQRANRYYLFTLSQLTYETTGGTQKELSFEPERNRIMYLSGTDGEQIFDTKAEYFEKAVYGVAGTPEVETLAEEIYEKLLEGGA